MGEGVTIQLVGDARRGGLVDVGDHDPGALLHQLTDDRTTDPGAAPGHDRMPTRQASHRPSRFHAISVHLAKGFPDPRGV
jgi:hypothetical protein